VPTAPLSFITAKALTVAIDLERPQRQLRPERGRFGMDAMGATDHHRVAVTVGELDQCRQQRRGSIDQQVGGVGHLPAQRGVADVTRRQPVVDPLAGVGTGLLVDRRLDDVDEGRHVVIGDRFPVEHRLHEPVVDDRGVGAARFGVGGRHDALGDVRLGGEQLDLEPARQLGDVGPHGTHLGGRVARDHGALTPSTRGSRRARRRPRRP
jgi:hypothetical protein